jgi:Kdo2-lipid IVA lauroyltransferase/acyltransferase
MRIMKAARRIMAQRISMAARAGAYAALGLLPTELVSALGSRQVRAHVRAHRPDILAGARTNLRFHFPDADDAALDRMTEAFLDGVGRMMAEFAVMPRFLGEGRLETEGLEAFRQIAGTRPVLAFGLHTGNWETFGPLFQHAGIPLTSFYMPPDDPFERQVAERSRARFGVRLLRPDAQGVREGLRALRRNGVVMIFPDEARDGRTLGPLFGRPPHDRGNLAVAARLARHTGASFVLCHSARIAPCRFRLVITAPFDLPPAQGRPDVLADVAFLNGHVEPVVRANLPRWYFLDDRLDVTGDEINKDISS